jgi:hypothetical protein
MRWIAAGSVATIGALVVIGVATSSGGGGHSSSPARPAKVTAAPPDQNKLHPPAKDLDFIRLVDKGSYGVADIWVRLQITNHSSKTSDYDVQYDVTRNSTGQRVYHGETLEDAVRPSQTATDDDITTNINGVNGYTVHVVSVVRQESLG